MLQIFFSLSLLLAFQVGQARSMEVQARITQEFKHLGGPQKALEQTFCFLKNNGLADFQSPSARGSMASRCGNKNLRISNQRYVGIIDYTQNSNRKRFFILDLKSGGVRSYFVSHGRYGETHRGNRTLRNSPRMNSVLKAIHFSNKPGMNATTGGFYITGGEYIGKYGRSQVLFGLENGINENACERAVVIHPSSNVNSSGVHAMSSGCPMVARDKINEVLGALRGGALLYKYTPVEAALSASKCGRNLLRRTKPMN